LEAVVNVPKVFRILIHFFIFNLKCIFKETTFMIEKFFLQSLLSRNVEPIPTAARQKFATLALASMHALSLNVELMPSARPLCMTLHVPVVQDSLEMAGMVVSNVSILMISDLNPIQLKPL
jgi:hypothetical protein